jgi:hypothetical protein
VCFSTHKVVRHPAPIVLVPSIVFGHGTGSRIRGGHTEVIDMCLRHADGAGVRETSVLLCICGPLQ